LTALRQDGLGGMRTGRPPRCCAFAFGCFEPLERFSEVATSSSGGSSSSLPSESTHTVSYSCRRSFYMRRRCFLVGMDG
jgi:hypothetical protein